MTQLEMFDDAPHFAPEWTRESAFKLWRLILGTLRRTVAADAYAIWFAPAVPLRMERNELVVEVASPAAVAWIAEHFADRVNEAAGSWRCGPVRFVAP